MSSYQTNYRKPISIIVASVLCAFSLFFMTTSSTAAAETKINRISGADRYETSVKVSQTGWSAGAETVVIAVGDNFPDALAGAPLAAKHNAPILLVTKEKIPYGVMKEIERLGAEKAYILGGNSVISPTIESQLKDRGIKVERVAGKNRYETAAKIANLVGGTKAVVTYGGDFPDSLAIAPVAASQSMPILLTDKNNIPEETKKVLTEYSSFILVGGKGVISENVENNLPNATRIAGKDRYDTSTKVAEKFFSSQSVNTSIIAAGESFADALTGSVLAAKGKAPVLLTQSKNVPAAIKETVEKLGIDQLTIIGGTSVISAEVQSQFGFDRQALVQTAKQYLGVPYLWGGTTPSGFDCSGYLNYVYDKHGIDLPRTTSDIWNFGSRTGTPEIGDIVMFETYKPGPSHAGIYIGNNEFIHSGNRGVEITSMNNVYFKPRYLGAVKVID
ncbi:cell wall-binding repeat-containing protein [Bacillus sp. SCS-153A]|uniref:cell wall-binding repeat-containing protein n=1 Tax=Rossellomorea sedimentorum TaxID=3115294 RepID=UPI003905C431